MNTLRRMLIYFNPRPLIRGDNCISLGYCLNPKFQSTPPHKGRPLYADIRLHILHFNPRPLIRGDSIKLKKLQISVNFNPRPLIRGDDNAACFKCNTQDFNPRPLIRGDSYADSIEDAARISIHAPS